MGTLVPPEDMPTGPVPADDLPVASTQGPRNVLDRGAAKFGEGLVPGFQRVSALLQAAADPVLGRNAEWGPDYSTRFNEHLRANLGESQQTERDAPWLSAGLKTAGGALLGRAVLPTAPVGSAPLQAAPRLVSATQGARTGAVMGAGYGVGDAPADAGLAQLASHAFGGAAVGGVLGGTLGGLMPAHAPGRSGAVQESAPAVAPEPGQVLGGTITPVETRPSGLRVAVDKRVTPTPEAQYLEGEGVRLTAGLRNPRSVVGQVETASQSLKGVGPAIMGQRDEARKATQTLILNKVLPPGMKPVKQAGELSDALDSIYQGFGKAYEAVKGDDIFPAIHADGRGVPLQTKGKSIGAFDQILSDKGIMATKDTRASVRGFLENELSMLPERKGAVGRVPVDRMLAMRSNIRTQIRQTLRGNSTREDFAAAEFLKRAEQAVTDAIESQVSPETAATLKAIDGQYRNYKIVEAAVAKAGERVTGFNGPQLVNALRESQSTGQFARGGGGELRDLARAFTRTFDESAQPPTGARILGTGALGEYLTGPMIFTLNRGVPVTGRPAIPGSLPASKMTVSGDPLLAAMARALGAPRLAPAGGVADEEATK